MPLQTRGIFVTLISENSLSYSQAMTIKDEVVWDRMQYLTIGEIIQDWLEGFKKNTKLTYSFGVGVLEKHGIWNLSNSLQSFSLVNHNAVVDRIKHLPMAETSRQARAALYLSFISYLRRRFSGVFYRATPQKHGVNKTFFQVYEKCKTNAMNMHQWNKFLDALDKISKKHCLFAKIALQGGKRVSEVLTLTIDKINWESREITFTESKTRGMIKETVITYPKSIIDELKYLVGDREGLVFITKYGKQIARSHIDRSFKFAGMDAGIEFKVTPHVLRASCVTYLKQQGYSDSDIMKVTGHSCSKVLNSYDKSSRSDNPTKYVSLI